jgi:hypothetical protein
MANQALLDMIWATSFIEEIGKYASENHPNILDPYPDF